MMPNLAILVQFILLSSVSFQWMEPVVLIMPEMALSNVVFPAPLEPMRQAISPCLTLRSTPLSASMGP